MGFAVSISESKENVWLINNATARWLLQVVLDRLSDDAEAAHAIQVSEYVGGIALDSLHQDNPRLAHRVVAAMTLVVHEIVNRNLRFVDDDGRSHDLSQTFEELLRILKQYSARFPPEGEP
jgi:hypothetical protein